MGFKKTNESNMIKDITKFQSFVGSILYLANCTRPDNSFAASKLCQYISAPSTMQMNVAKRILAYLKGTAE